VSGAEVGFAMFAPLARILYLTYYGQAVTGPDGKFLIDHLPAAAFKLSVRAEGYAPYTGPWLQTGTTGLEVQLDVGALVSGRVINIQTGEGVAGVVVKGNEVQENPKKPFSTFSGDTDSEGAFRISGWQPGVYELCVKPKRYQATPLAQIERLKSNGGHAINCRPGSKDGHGWSAARPRD